MSAQSGGCRLYRINLDLSLGLCLIFASLIGRHKTCSLQIKQKPAATCPASNRPNF